MGVVLMGVAPAPVFAESELELSVDGVHWVNAITDPLFDPDMRWVPGDSEDATFFIRNSGGTSGDLTVDVLGTSAGTLLDSGSLHVTAKGGGGSWLSVSEPGAHRLLSAPDIPDGATEAIAVNVTFDSAATDNTQLLASNLAFRVTLTQSSGSAGLPDTGAPDLRWFAALSAVLTGTGIALVARRREPRRKVHHV